MPDRVFFERKHFLHFFTFFNIYQWLTGKSHLTPKKVLLIKILKKVVLDKTIPCFTYIIFSYEDKSLLYYISLLHVVTLFRQHGKEVLFVVCKLIILISIHNRHNFYTAYFFFVFFVFFILLNCRNSQTTVFSQIRCKIRSVGMYQTHYEKKTYVDYTRKVILKTLVWGRLKRGSTWVPKNYLPIFFQRQMRFLVCQLH